MAFVTQQEYSYFENKRVFLTGGTGFLGSTFLQTLCSQSKIHSIQMIVRTISAKEKLLENQKIFQMKEKINFILCDLNNINM
jgi:thioester reductase-like protein